MRLPIHRSKLRLFIGKLYFRLKRHLYWYFSRVNFANHFENKLPIEIFTHQSLLRKKLKNVEMWMQENKIINLKIAIKKLNKLVIQPGQTFSYWRQIGKPNKKKGYLEGMVLHNGTVITDIGGGLCQLSENALLDDATHPINSY